MTDFGANAGLIPPVKNADLADMPLNTFKGRDGPGAGTPEDLTIAETKAVLDYQSSDIDIATVGPSVVITTLAGKNNTIDSAGGAEGSGCATDNGGGTIVITASEGWVRDTASAAAQLFSFKSLALGSTAIPADVSRFYGVEFVDSSSDPIIVLRTADNFNGLDEFPLGSVTNTDGTISITNAQQQTGNVIARVNQRSHEVDRIERDKRTGSGLLLGTSGLTITINAGALWDRMNRFPALSTDFAAFDSGVADTFVTIFSRSPGGPPNFDTEAAQTALDNTRFDDGTGTSLLTMNNWTTRWIYYLTDGMVVERLGTTNGNKSAADAEEEPTQADMTRLHGILIAKIVIQDGAVSIVAGDIDFFPNEQGGGAGGAGDHAVLSNLAVTASGHTFSATDLLFGRATAGAGVGEEIVLTAAGRAFIDDATAADQRTTLGLGTIAVEPEVNYALLAGRTGGQLIDKSLSVQGEATSVLTGSIDPTASTAVVGVGTLFTTELVIGDSITVTGETRRVVVITDSTNLTVNEAFSDNANDVSPDRLAAEFRILDSAGNVDVISGNQELLVEQPLTITNPLSSATEALTVNQNCDSFASQFWNVAGETVAQLSHFGGPEPIFVLVDQSGAANTRIALNASATRVSYIDGGPVGIGTKTPITSAKLDITSTTGALVPPRMTTTQRDALTASNSMLLYNSTTNKFQGRENGAWVNFSSNSFETMSTPAGTSPVADNATDTLTWLAGAGVSITGDSATDSITIANTDPNVDQNLWLTFNADTGTTAANTTTDAITIAGGTNVTTAIVGDVVTINGAAGTSQNLFETFATPGGTSPVADTPTDTLTFANGNAITITGDSGTDTVTIAAVAATTTVDGVVELATDAETNTGTDTTRAITPSNITAWTGSVNLATLGTITAGTWAATDVAVLHGGTGSSTAGGARTNLGLVIGTDVQGFDANLEDLAALGVVADNQFTVGSGAGTYVFESPTTVRTTLGVAYGKKTIAIPAASFYSTTTAGAGDPVKVEIAAGFDVEVVPFDAAADEHIQIAFPLPKAWNAGTITYKIHWKADTATTGNVIWAVKAVALSDGQLINTAFGTAVNVTDTVLGSITEVLTTAESGALTIGNTPSKEDLIYIDVSRDADNASDTMTGDAQLWVFELRYTVDAGNDD